MINNIVLKEIFQLIFFIFSLNILELQKLSALIFEELQNLLIDLYEIQIIPDDFMIV